MKCGTRSAYVTGCRCAACRDANNAYNRAYYWKNLEKSRARNREAAKRLYYKDLASSRGRVSAKAREFRVANPEAVRGYKRKRYQKVLDENSRYRARRRNAPKVEQIDRDYVYQRERGRCHICGKAVSHDKFTVDHLVALAAGGSHTLDNVRIAHRGCNSSMGVHREPAQLLLLG